MAESRITGNGARYVPQRLHSAAFQRGKTCQQIVTALKKYFEETGDDGFFNLIVDGENYEISRGSVVRRSSEERKSQDAARADRRKATFTAIVDLCEERIGAKAPDREALIAEVEQKLRGWITIA